MQNKVFLLLMIMFALTVVVSTSEAQTKNKMKYLVIGEAVDALFVIQPMQEMLEHAVIPSLDMLAKWESDKKITGGIYVGDRKVVFVLDAESNEEVDKMLQSLPYWGLLKWNVSALHTFEGRSAQEKIAVEKMKTLAK